MIKFLDELTLEHFGNEVLVLPWLDLYPEAIVSLQYYVNL